VLRSSEGVGGVTAAPPGATIQLLTYKLTLTGYYLRHHVRKTHTFAIRYSRKMTLKRCVSDADWRHYLVVQTQIAARRRKLMHVLMGKKSTN